MAWFVDLLGGFGRFFPEGTITDRALDTIEERAEASRTFRGGGRKLQPDEMPQAYEVYNIPKKFGSMFMIQNSLFVVQEPLHELIERLDPGRQQFWPITLHHEKSGLIEGPFFGMNVVPAIDTLIVGKSAMHRPGNKPTYKYRLDEDHKKPSGKRMNAVMDRASRDGCHLWHEASVAHNLFISDDLRNEIKARKMLFPRLEYIAEE